MHYMFLALLLVFSVTGCSATRPQYWQVTIRDEQGQIILQDVSITISPSDKPSVPIYDGDEPITVPIAYWRRLDFKDSWCVLQPGWIFESNEINTVAEGKAYIRTLPVEKDQ